MLKKHLLATSAISTVFAFATNAHAGATLEVFGGGSFFGDDTLFATTKTSFTTAITRITATAAISAKVDKNVGYNEGVIAGYQFDNNFGLGAEFAYRRASFDIRGGLKGTFATYFPAGATTFTFTTPVSTTVTGSGNLRALALMADASYEFNLGSKFSPYLEAGAGVSWVRAKGDATATFFAASPFVSGTLTHTTTLSQSETNFAWQVGGGVDYAISDKIDLTIGYRYFDGGDISAEEGKIDVVSHDVKAGLKYKF